jgi:hypothetical protein
VYRSCRPASEKDARLGEFRDKFTALEPSKLSARRRIRRSVALAIEFFLRQQLPKLLTYVLSSSPAPTSST